MIRDKKTTSDLLSRLRSSFKKRKCLAPKGYKAPCHLKKIKAHSISKSSAIEKIAEGGHVLRLTVDSFSEGDDLQEKLIGVNKATIFYGFCRKHDTDIFQLIDSPKGKIGSRKQLMLLGYRAVCWRLYHKECSVDLCNNLNFDEHIEGAQEACTDIRLFKNKYDDILLRSSENNLIHLVIRIDSVPPVMGIGFFIPEFSLTSKPINDLSDTTAQPKGVAVSCIADPYDDNGLITLSATPDSIEILVDFHDYLMGKNGNEILEVIVKLLFAFEENIIVSPSWWRGLSREIQNILNDIFKLNTCEPI